MATLATLCAHLDRPMKARGLCKPCWSKEQRVNWVRKVAGAKGAEAIVPKPRTKDGLVARKDGKPDRRRSRAVLAELPDPKPISPVPGGFVSQSAESFVWTGEAAGSTDATDRAKKAARATGDKVRTVAKVDGPGAGEAGTWTVRLAVRPVQVGKVVAPALPPAEKAAAPKEPVEVCGVCGGSYSKSNRSRHAKRHAAVAVGA